jgi:hypothetical protein
MENWVRTSSAASQSPAASPSAPTQAAAAQPQPAAVHAGRLIPVEAVHAGETLAASMHSASGRRLEPNARTLASAAPATEGNVAAPPASAVVSQPTPREAPHNVYLEYLLYGGIASAAGLIIVLTMLLGLTLRYAWQMRRSPAFPFASSLALAVLFVAAINYGNVTMHLSFVWVLFGLVTACASSSLQGDDRRA